MKIEKIDELLTQYIYEKNMENSNIPKTMTYKDNIERITNIKQN